MEQFAAMNIEKGKNFVTALVSGHIPGTGRYKFLAKKNKGTFVWAPFTERDSGQKENVYRGEVKDRQELNLVLEIMNKTLKKRI